MKITESTLQSLHVSFIKKKHLSQCILIHTTINNMCFILQAAVNDARNYYDYFHLSPIKVNSQKFIF